MADDSQQAVMEFLARPRRHGGAAVTRIDTHAAAVFLAGERALKIKRAVRFPFLDFSTLDKRKAACEAEIEVNRPFAPAIYRGVVAITREAAAASRSAATASRSNGRSTCAASTRQQTLDHLAERGEIDERLADALGRAVAKAHAAAPVGDGFVDELAEVIAQNDAELRAQPGAVCAAAGGGADARRRARPSRACGRCSRARERDGLVRRCHGDLHLGNIVLHRRRSRRCSTPSSSIRRSRPATCSTISLSC